MFKKLIAAFSMWAMLGSVITMPVFAADIPDALIDSVTLSVAGATPQTFEPTASQVLKTAVVFNAAFSEELKKSTGYARVIQGTTVIKNLTTWTDGNVPTAIADWNGKDIDNTAEAKNVCGTAGAACPVGDYKMEVRVEYTSGANKRFELETADFKVFVTPAVAISNLAISKASFNPATETADISFQTSADGFITVEILDGTTVKNTLINNKSLVKGTYSKTNEATLGWNGKDSAGTTLPNKTYTIKVTSRKDATGSVLDTKTVTTDVSLPATVAITAFNVKVTPTNTTGLFDPALKGANEDLTIDYSLNQAADSVIIEIKDAKGSVIKTFPSVSKSTDNFTWDGTIAGTTLLALPGNYTVNISAAKSGNATATGSKPITITYSNTGKGSISNFTVTPDSYDPDVEDAIIAFTNTVDTNVTVEVQNLSDNGVQRTFVGFQNDNFSANAKHSIPWNGKTTGSSSQVSLGTYRVVAVVRNDFGVVSVEKNITVNDSGGTVSTENSHVGGISFSPSSNFDPAENDQLKIQFDVLQNLDSLKVYAMRGTEKIELLTETNLAKENNIDIEWDGTNDAGDYVAAGSWKIQFESKVGTSSLLAAKSINVTYEKPKIDDVYLSKSKFDPEQGEFTTIFFRTDQDADITIELLQDNNEQETITEEMEVKGGKWYAVTWDGSGYNYDDNLDLKILAQNTANHDVFNSKKISVDLAEDEVASSKSNITQDYIDPVVTSGNESMVLHYNIEEDADVLVSIHKGTSSSGNTVITLLDVEDQDAGDHEIAWNGKDDKGNKLSNGIYTYKITSMTSSSESESGQFVVGNVGDGGDVGSSSSSSSSSSGKGKVSPGVTIDGQSGSNTSVTTGGGSGSVKEEVELCAGFTDMISTESGCEAVEWTKQEGIFKGYPDGSFGPDNEINRVELLKVIVEALGMPVSSSVAGNLGYKDVIVGAWYMPYLQVGKTRGIMTGDAGKGTVRPDGSTNRAETIKLILEGMRSAGKISVISGKCSTYPSDVPANAWYAKYVCQLAESLGTDLSATDTFGPANMATRLEVAELLYELHLRNLF